MSGLPVCPRSSFLGSRVEARRAGMTMVLRSVEPVAHATGRRLGGQLAVRPAADARASMQILLDDQMVSHVRCSTKSFAQTNASVPAFGQEKEDARLCANRSRGHSRAIAWGSV